ncbi:MAG: sodium:solute symporter, partial [Clostridia bacterium]|nr:sodium:solute symporter [Clostridia bacterium]
MVLDILVLVLFVLGMIAIALYTRKKANTSDDFLLAGKKGLNGWMSAFSYGTTYFSAVIFIGYAGKFGANFGLSAIWIGIGNAFLGGLVAWLLMAKKTKNMTQRLNAKTMPDFFEKRYDSLFLKKISAVIIFLFLIPYASSVYNGLGNLFSAMFGIEKTWIVIVALAVLTAIYLIFGGYFATSLSDFVQGIIMLAGVIVMVIFFMANDNVGGFDLFNRLSSIDKGLFIKDSGTGKFIDSPVVSLISLILLTSMGVYGLPQTVHKYYTVRDKKAIKQGMIVTTIFAFIVGV